MASASSKSRRKRLLGSLDPKFREKLAGKRKPVPSEGLILHLKEMFWDVAGSPDEPPARYHYRLGARAVVEYLESLHLAAEEGEEEHED